MPDKPFQLVVRAVICDPQGQCLLIRRSSACKRFVGRWEWPGGKVDQGEDFDAALRREVREETGLEVEPASVVGAIGFEMEKAKVALLCMEARLAGGTLALSEEHDGHVWVSPEEALQWELTDGLQELAKACLAKLKSDGRSA